MHGGVGWAGGGEGRGRRALGYRARPPQVGKGHPRPGTEVGPPRPSPWTHFFLSELSVSGGMPTMVTVPCSTLRGAAITKGSSLQRRFFVCWRDAHLNHGLCPDKHPQRPGAPRRPSPQATAPASGAASCSPYLLQVLTWLSPPPGGHPRPMPPPPTSIEQDPSPGGPPPWRPPTLTEHTKDLSRCLLSRLREAGLENSTTSGVPCGRRVGGQGQPGGLVGARARRGADLREGAVEEGPLGDDEVGAEAAGDGLLCGTQLLLGELQAAVELVQVTPATEDAQRGHRLTGRPAPTGGRVDALPSSGPARLPQERKQRSVYPQGWTCWRGAGVRGQETGSQQRCLQGSDWGGGEAPGTLPPGRWISTLLPLQGGSPLGSSEAFKRTSIPSR